MGNDKESKVFSRLQFFIWVTLQSGILVGGGAWFMGRQGQAIEGIIVNQRAHSADIRRIDTEGSAKWKTVDVYTEKESARIEQRLLAIETIAARNNETVIRINEALVRIETQLKNK